MKLTKDECIKALHALYFSDGSDGRDDEFYDVLLKLIKDHFDYPSLKFEELKESEVYWHVYYGWIMIESIHDDECIVITTLGGAGYETIQFEEDCFYRKQVEE